MPYRPIGDYGIIGDLHTAALVASNGAIDWLCLPTFDAPSLFAGILDQGKGGTWRIAPSGEWTSQQRYLPGTNVLVTAFHGTGGGVVEVTDFMPVGPARSTRPELHRRVTCTRGEAEIEVAFTPAFDYARRGARISPRTAGLLATDAEDHALTLAGPPGLAWETGNGSATARFPARPGEPAWLVLRWDDDDVHPVASYTSQSRLDQTALWWDEWVSRLDYHGPYRQEVERSALALKLCCYEPTGAIVGAPTTSLPERPGGERNWDYRYTWLRDSAFVLFALDRLGFDGEADGFLRFLKRVCRRADGRHVQIMFGIDGRRSLPEEILGHLEGYRGAKPVRIGNSAAGQFQLDVYGELLETVSTPKMRKHLSEGLWSALRALVDWTAAHWREPDWSIWEARQEPKPYVYSRVMAWAALDRGIKLAQALGTPADVSTWVEARDACHAEVLERGWDRERQTFVQVYGEPQLDAALLVIPLIGFLPRRDPRVRSTLAAVRKELGSSVEELIYRYRSPDGLDGDEGAFVVCSFWMVQNLAMIGEIEEAERLFKNLLRRVNRVGLLAEEIDPGTGEQLGNFPQALSHAALLNAACTLERLRPRAPESGAAG
ncbi:MAG TPA: glycoside hydrolase family 15 protein [Gemmatimonadales bacterium]|nr:glycoside hydrolase family 15 protein [Gemmatimonadales bacterium]